jgi:hypothetical protein
MSHEKNRLLRNCQTWRKEKQYSQNENDDAFTHTLFSSTAQQDEICEA